VPLTRRTSWTAAELMATTFPEQRWAVRGLVAEGLTLLVGPPKAGKSWAVLGIGIAVAHGGKAFNKVDVDAGAVLYLALEDTPRRLQQRLGKVLAGEPAPKQLTIATECPALSAGGTERIAEWLDSHPDARLVIVDVFARVRERAQATQGNAYDADYQAMCALKLLADRYGVAVLVLHHTRKAAAEDFLDTVSGTQGLAGAADAVAVLRRTRGQADAELFITGRDVEEAAYALTFDAGRGAWQMLDGPALDYTVSDTRRAILRHIRVTGPATPKQLADALGIDHNTAKQRCWQMSRDGQLDVAAGVYCLPITDNPRNRVTGVEPLEGYGVTEVMGYDGVKK
jgi:hypothetical protein